MRVMLRDWLVRTTRYRVIVPPIVLAEAGFTKALHRNVSSDQIVPFSPKWRIDAIRAELGITVNQAEAWSSYEAALENYRNEIRSAHQRELRTLLRIEGNPLSPAGQFGSKF